MTQRKAEIERKTKETVIKVVLNIDGTGESKINTGIGFLDHMLELFSFWGRFDLNASAKGDLKIDIHHTNEDLGLVLGQAFKEALGDKEGINRMGYASVPMEDVTASVTLDISGRGSYKLNVAQSAWAHPAGQDGYDFKYFEHFADSFAKKLGMNLNVRLENPNKDLHATLEPIFKALGIALDQATQIDTRRKGVPSTKGVID